MTILPEQDFRNADNVLGSMFGSGTLYVGVDAQSNLYEAAQSFVSGASNGLDGVSLSSSVWRDKYAYIGKITLGKNAAKGLYYSAKGMASDFAYTKQKYYLNRNFKEFAMVFGSSNVNGLLNSLA